MLPTEDFFRIILSLVLTIIFTTGSFELRLAVGTLLSWALGLILHQRLALSPAFLRRHAVCIFASFWLLAAYNNLFYQNVIGRPLDLFFGRDEHDLETPGSGFSLWLETADEEFEWVMGIFRIIFLTVVALTTAVLLSAAMLLDSIANTAYPSSVQVQAPQAKSKHDTRYVYLSDELISVCGRYGGFESVVAGDLEAAIRRRRPSEPVWGVVAGNYTSRPHGRRMRFS
ncbi:hypothetical protein IQ06DRAFT_146218 [Phaeosphaeriaceae sp. SRC1lsM3a]|nr:hypothetical protein IQ06DRAFT_146218 [Stagonospora sp. SRC1lsM3a]